MFITEEMSGFFHSMVYMTIFGAVVWGFNHLCMMGVFA
jgi:hypothetical protein